MLCCVGDFRTFFPSFRVDDHFSLLFPPPPPALKRRKKRRRRRPILEGRRKRRGMGKLLLSLRPPSYFLYLLTQGSELKKKGFLEIFASIGRATGFFSNFKILANSHKHWPRFSSFPSFHTFTKHLPSSSSYETGGRRRNIWIWVSSSSPLLLLHLDVVVYAEGRGEGRKRERQRSQV